MIRQKRKGSSKNVEKKDTGTINTEKKGLNIEEPLACQTIA